MGDIVVLKQPDSSQSPRSHSQTRLRVFDRHSSQREDRNVVSAGGTQGIKAEGMGAGFFKYGTEDSEICTGARGEADFFFGVAGDRDQPVSGFSFLVSRSEAVDRSRVRYGDIFGAKVDAIGGNGQRYVATGVDEKARCRVLLTSDCFECVVRQGFQLAAREVFFAELDEIHSAKCGFSDLV